MRDANGKGSFVDAVDLGQAIKGGDLRLYYQPKVDLRSGVTKGVEALARWKHPDLGLLVPADFIHLAKGNGLLVDLAYWALNESLEQAQEWRRAGLSLGVAVNLSGENLADPNLTDAVRDAVDRWKGDASSLELEITETEVMNFEGSIEVLHDLSSMGVSLALDDFGTGYSSLAYLQRLPVSALKIDRSFVMNMAVDRTESMIVEFIIELARNLGLELVAEGVRTGEIARRLGRLGCDLGQGYYFSPPMPAEEVPAWVSSHRPPADHKPDGVAKVTEVRHPARTRVVVVEDHTLLRQSLVRAVANEPGFEVVAEIDRGDEAFEAVKKYRPDLVLLDIGLPGENGLNVAARLRKELPMLRVVFLTMHDDDQTIHTAVGLGADGYVSKTASTEELLGGLRAVASGSSYFSPAVQRRLRDPLGGLGRTLGATSS